MKKLTSISLALLAALASTTAMAQVLPLSAIPRPATPSSLPAGLYVSVIQGQIQVTNPSGTSNFSAGQFGYTASQTQPPIPVPKVPPLPFTPPLTFSATPPGSGSNASAPKVVDCEVR